MNKDQILNWIMENVKEGDMIKIERDSFDKDKKGNLIRYTKKLKEIVE